MRGGAAGSRQQEQPPQQPSHRGSHVTVCRRWTPGLYSGPLQPKSGQSDFLAGIFDVGGIRWLSINCLLVLLDLDPWSFTELLHVLMWYIAVLLGQVVVRREHGRAFWQSMDVSGLQIELTTILDQCGYDLEVQRCKLPYYLKFVVYKKEGIRQSLPKIGVTNETNEAEAQKTLLLLETLGTFRYGKTYEEDNDDDLIFATSVDVSEIPLYPLDFWTIRGLLLGRILNIKARARAMSFRLVAFFLVLQVYSTYTGYGDDVSLLWIFVMVWEICSIGSINSSKFHCANRDLVSHLSPLIEKRHNGCSLCYKIQARRGWNPYSIRKLGELYVLEDPLFNRYPRDDSVV